MVLNLLVILWWFFYIIVEFSVRCRNLSDSLDGNYKTTYFLIMQAFIGSDMLAVYGDDQIYYRTL